MNIRCLGWILTLDWQVDYWKWTMHLLGCRCCCWNTMSRTTVSPNQCWPVYLRCRGPSATKTLSVAWTWGIWTYAASIRPDVQISTTPFISGNCRPIYTKSVFTLPTCPISSAPTRHSTKKLPTGTSPFEVQYPSRQRVLVCSLMNPNRKCLRRC